MHRGRRVIAVFQIDDVPTLPTQAGTLAASQACADFRFHDFANCIFKRRNVQQKTKTLRNSCVMILCIS